MQLVLFALLLVSSPATAGDTQLAVTTNVQSVLRVSTAVQQPDNVRLASLVLDNPFLVISGASHHEFTDKVKEEIVNGKLFWWRNETGALQITSQATGGNRAVVTIDSSVTLVNAVKEPRLIDLENLKFQVEARGGDISVTGVADEPRQFTQRDLDCLGEEC